MPVFAAVSFESVLAFAAFVPAFVVLVADFVPPVLAEELFLDDSGVPVSPVFAFSSSDEPGIRLPSPLPSPRFPLLTVLFFIFLPGFIFSCLMQLLL